MRLEEVRDALSLPGLRVERLADDDRVTLDKRDRVPVAREREGGRQPCDTTTEHDQRQPSHRARGYGRLVPAQTTPARGQRSVQPSRAVATRTSGEAVRRRASRSLA